jgi:hypothetical protein
MWLNFPQIIDSLCSISLAQDINEIDILTGVNCIFWQPKTRI